MPVPATSQNASRYRNPDPDRSVKRLTFERGGDQLRGNPDRRTRISRAAVMIICAVIVAAISVLAVTWQISMHAAALPRPSCGSGVTHHLDGGTQLLGADPGALTCFSTAARGCRPASIEVTEMGVDTGTYYVFTIEPGGTACQVTELSQDYSANFGGSAGPVSAISCRRTAVSRRGVALRCGGQDVLIPAQVSVR